MESEGMSDEKRLLDEGIDNWVRCKTEMAVMKSALDTKKKELETWSTMLDQRSRNYTKSFVSKLENPVTIGMTRVQKGYGSERTIVFFSQADFDTFLLRFREDRLLNESLKFVIYQPQSRNNEMIFSFIEAVWSFLGRDCLRTIDSVETIIDYIYARFDITKSDCKMELIDSLMNGGVYKQDVLEKFNKSMT